ncbi:MAG: hypothetical protein DRJ03_02485 [Chloroflexi bacterium]|nr:MAG: hypothetical protein DRJ03_02485 [Chloroflexota bacterium]
MKDITNMKEVTNFRWRTRKGVFVQPANMETRHLFFTLRMIWNHSAPEEMHLHPFQKYEFTEYYTVAYMRKAVRACVIELKRRTDLTHYYESQLATIYRYLSQGERVTW